MQGDRIYTHGILEYARYIVWYTYTRGTIFRQ